MAEPKPIWEAPLESNYVLIGGTTKGLTDKWAWYWMAWDGTGWRSTSGSRQHPTLFFSGHREFIEFENEVLNARP
jgi:hypothetical protein